MATILDRIVESKREEIRNAKVTVPESELRSQLKDAPPIRDFFLPLAAEGPIKLIAEVKKASPSKGIIRADFDPVTIATIYAQHGASCLSVLTDAPFFQGSLNNLRLVREAVDIPLLRKDFILDVYQLLEARVAGADAILLIAECLDDCNLRMLHNATLELGMTPLVELYDPENLDRVLTAGATLIGINNRDLRSFAVDLAHTVRVGAKVPDNCVLVGESGIHTRADVEFLQDAGVDAILVGEHLMSQKDIGAAVRDILGLPPTDFSS